MSTGQPKQKPGHAPNEFSIADFYGCWRAVEYLLRQSGRPIITVSRCMGKMFTVTDGMADFLFDHRGERGEDLVRSANIRIEGDHAVVLVDLTDHDEHDNLIDVDNKVLMRLAAKSFEEIKTYSSLTPTERGIITEEQFKMVKAAAKSGLF